MTDLNPPLLGERNAPCRACGAPLAEDQRYCLQCGTRRAEARLPFLDILGRRGGAPAAVTATTVGSRPGGGGRLSRMSASTAAIAGVACLLLALGTGVLIGGLGDGGSSSAATPQVISVGGAAPAAAPAASSAAPSTSAPAADDPATTPVKDKKSKESSSSRGDSKASNSAVKNLDSTSGKDYSKKSAKLPKTLGTGGKAPPKDKKAAAGGGSFQEIG